MTFTVQFLVVLLAFVCGSLAQNQYQQTTPVPILKQINRHNEDGSYSYGYEGADGSFKIESKYPDGRVFGKYGYVDAEGKLREIEYGASNRGFEPAGTGINVPPPTIHETNNNISPLEPGQEDDGQYREDPSIYYKSDQYNKSPVKSSAPTAFKTQFNIAPQQQQIQPQQFYNPQPVAQQYNYQPQQFYRPAPVAVDPNIFRGHPATNFDVNTGSYTINYSG